MGSKRRFRNVYTSRYHLKDNVFSKNGLILGLTGSDKEFEEFKNNVSIIFDNTDRRTTPYDKEPNFSYLNLQNPPGGSLLLRNSPYNSRTAYTLPYKTVDIYQGGNFIKEGFQYTGKLRVLKKVLTTGYLWNEVRDKRGAYGTGVYLTDNGVCMLFARRAFNIQGTLDAFRGIVNYIKNFNVSQEEMNNFIIGTVGDFDENLDTASKGINQINNMICGLDNEAQKKELEEVLSTTPQDIRNFANMLDKILKQNIYTVEGSEDLINDNKTLFDQIIPIFK